MPKWTIFGEVFANFGPFFAKSGPFFAKTERNCVVFDNFEKGRVVFALSRRGGHIRADFWPQRSQRTQRNII